MFEFSSFFLCPKILFSVNGKAAVWQTPCFNIENFAIFLLIGKSSQIYTRKTNSTH
jgi:hypothetical protein